MLDLTSIPIVDHHAHPLWRPEHLARLPYTASFTEGLSAEVQERHARETLCFRRSLRDIAPLLDCDPSLPAILSARERLGFDEVARRCLVAARFERLLLDDGLTPERTLPLDWHGRFAPVHRVLRVESLAEQLIRETATWAEFEAAFRAALADPSPETVAYKSIVAYRTGLRVDPPDPNAAARGFAILRRRAEAGRPIRLADKPLDDWIVHATLEVAAARARPVQFHTGFGDPDLDLRLANPLHLRPLIEARRFESVPFVLLHAGYPFTREAGYLAAVYANVHVDLGLAIPFLSVAGMRAAVRALFELSPLDKLLLSTDAHTIPELFYLGAHWGRRVLAAELTRAVEDGDLTVAEAETAAEAILRRNALGLYGLSG